VKPPQKKKENELEIIGVEKRSCLLKRIFRGVHNSTQTDISSLQWFVSKKNSDFKQETFVAFIEGREEMKGRLEGCWLMIVQWSI